MTINIDELTIGELRQIASLAAQLGLTVPTNSAKSAHPFTGKYVICRCYSAGVHAGELVSANGDEVILKNSRSLWYWKARNGIALSGVAQNGIASGSQVDSLNPEIALTGVIEIIPCTEASRESINAF